MKKTEIDLMSFDEVCITELLCTMRRFKDTLEKVEYYTEHYTNNVLHGAFICYLINSRNISCTKKFALYGDDLYRMLDSLKEQFPDIPIINTKASEERQCSTILNG